MSGAVELEAELREARENRDSHQRVAMAALQRAEAAEAAQAALLAQVEQMRGALEEISERHIPDQPASYGGDELSWAQRQHGALRQIARAALTKEPS